MKTAKLTLVADKWCPTSRTYCTYLAAAGFKFEKIILVDFLFENKKFEKLRRLVGSSIARLLMSGKRADWPDYNDLQHLFDPIQKDTKHKIDYSSPFNFSEYSDQIVEYMALDYQDKYFQGFLLKHSENPFLYTNGGIVPPEVLDHPEIKILHIHPGIVPDIRGSDGLLWSLLMKGKPGVSCFYMDSGIDTGTLIDQKEFPRSEFSVSPPTDLKQEDLLYRALLIAYDPHLRASLLRDIVTKADGVNLHNLQTSSINNAETESFLWMHPLMRQQVISKVCNA